jgi:hypothetical protein
MKILNRRMLGFSGALSVCFVVQVQASITTVVTPGNMDGWVFSADAIGAVGQMVTGPGTPPLGSGSAQLAVPAGQGGNSSQLFETLSSPLALSSLTSLSYSTYDTANNGQQFPFLKLYLDNGDALYFEPPYQTPGTGGPAVVDQGPTALNQWQTWNALSGAWWDDNTELGSGILYGGYKGVDTLAAYLALSGNADVAITKSAF